MIEHIRTDTPGIKQCLRVFVLTSVYFLTIQLLINAAANGVGGRLSGQHAKQWCMVIATTAALALAAVVGNKGGCLVELAGVGLGGSLLVLVPGLKQV